jgi:hypothetical protein
MMGPNSKLPANAADNEPNYSGLRPSDQTAVIPGASVYNEKTGYFEPALDWPEKPPLPQPRSTVLHHGVGQATGSEPVFCTHPAQSPVAQLSDKCKLFIGAGYDIRGLDKYSLAVDCGDVLDVYGGHKFPAGYEHLLECLPKAPPIIKLAWRDYGTPSLLYSFWEKLYESLPDGNILFCCHGGHGRSGSALAAILIIAWNISAAKAIQTVRKHHCHKAVETNAQREYLVGLSKWWAKQCGKPIDDSVVMVEEAEIEPIDTSPMSEFSMVDYLNGV